jgi:hypothetical protein
VTIQQRPSGLLSLLDIKGGDSPSDMSQQLIPTIDLLQLYLQQQILIDESGSAVAANTPDQLIYPLLAAVPQGFIRYFVRAASNVVWGAGGDYVVHQGWVITRGSTGSTYPVGGVAHGTIFAASPGVGGTGGQNVPYTCLEHFILGSGDRLGVMVSTGAGTSGQVNFGIRYVDLKQ